MNEWNAFTNKREMMIIIQMENLQESNKRQFQSVINGILLKK